MKKRKSIGFLLVSFAFVTLFSRATSFLYVFEGADPSIFKQMGLALLKGKTLYIDYFDNKGCLLYFIHALGLWLGGDFFILLMQTLSLTVTLLLWNKMLALYKNRHQRIVCLGVGLFLLACFYGAGDQSQEWCLPFISYSLLVFLQSYKNNLDIQPKQMLLIGLCFGIITFIQVNNAVAFLGFVAYLWIQYLLKKDFHKLFQSIGCFVAGWLTIAIPCVLYFYVKAGWSGVNEMVYGSFLSNFEYISNQWKPRWTQVLPYILFLVALLAIQIMETHKKKDLLIPFLISFLLFVGTFGKQCNQFYLIAMIPLVMTSLTTIDFAQKRKTVYGLCGVALACLAFYASSPVLHLVNDLILHKEKELVIYNSFHECIENIPMADRDSIYNYNLYWHGTSMMQHERLLGSPAKPCVKSYEKRTIFAEKIVNHGYTHITQQIVASGGSFRLFHHHISVRPRGRG